MATTANDRGIYYNDKGKKTFVPLENNPEVFNDLVHRLGLSSELGFYDVYSIDEPDMLAFVPRPVHALIFISPAPVYYRVREHDGSGDITYDKAGDQEPVMWFEQTIGNACGLYSLIHAVANGSARQYIKQDSLIDKLLAEALPLKRAQRADVLYNSKELEEAHMSCAVGGDSTVPQADEPVGYHFITFAKGNDGHLWELEGDWDPIDRGVLDDSEDMLSEKALELGIRKFVRECQATGIIEFSIIALATRPE
ncbi:hypothetical protein MCOR25_002747 [Pyricularia grisea]|uniref:Ubiquitin carboxyl-terminal hydrolase n=1 Tax=Pyricularia grisea TaxID=148305 RepID=A0A6P8ARS1_PYRGI|nr:uncharacterized protein PgNI_09927 [Pyricularia grisea]KAI6376536.1 hypothetical protein MCOR25_002747 [Pyricularia grisea]TLD04792.1 hypothetical protein PgNI_09927 [Pyricularia grisea]